MPVPIVWRKGSSAIATYSSTDLASGSGEVQYYGGDLSGGTVLRSSTFYSEAIETRAAGGDSTSFKNVFSGKNFDILFNLPRTIKGTVIISVPGGIATTVGGSKTYYNELIASVRKWDGTTETHLISGASLFQFDATGAGQNKSVFHGIAVDVPRTLFKKGETLRVVLDLWGKSNDGTVATYAVGHDPKNRAGTTISSGDTNMLVSVPFQINS